MSNDKKSLTRISPQRNVLLSFRRALADSPQEISEAIVNTWLQNSLSKAAGIVSKDKYKELIKFAEQATLSNVYNVPSGRIASQLSTSHEKIISMLVNLDLELPDKFTFSDSTLSGISWHPDLFFNLKTNGLQAILFDLTGGKYFYDGELIFPSNTYIYVEDKDLNKKFKSFIVNDMYWTNGKNLAWKSFFQSWLRMPYDFMEFSSDLRNWVDNPDNVHLAHPSMVTEQEEIWTLLNIKDVVFHHPDLKFKINLIDDTIINDFMNFKISRKPVGFNDDEYKHVSYLSKANRYSNRYDCVIFINNLFEYAFSKDKDYVHDFFYKIEKDGKTRDQLTRESFDNKGGCFFLMDIIVDYTHDDSSAIFRLNYDEDQCAYYVSDSVNNHNRKEYLTFGNTVASLSFDDTLNHYLSSEYNNYLTLTTGEEKRERFELVYSPNVEDAFSHIFEIAQGEERDVVLPFISSEFFDNYFDIEDSMLSTLNKISNEKFKKEISKLIESNSKFELLMTEPLKELKTKDVKWFNNFITSSKTEFLDKWKYIFDSALTFVLNDKYQKQEDIQIFINTQLTELDEALSIAASSMKDLTKVDKVTDGYNTMSQIIEAFTSNFDAFCDEMNIKDRSRKKTKFSDIFINSQYKLNEFKHDYLYWLQEMMSEYKEANDYFESREILRKPNFNPDVENNNFSELVLEAEEITRKAVAKTDISLALIDVAWVGKLMLNALESLATNMINAVSIIDNILNILVKDKTNFTYNKNANLLYKDGSYYTLIGQDANYIINKGVTTIQGCSTALYTPSIISNQNMYYYFKSVDKLYFELLMDSKQNGASKLVTLLSDEYLQMKYNIKAGYTPSPSEEGAAWGFVAAQAAMAGAAAAVTSSGLIGKAIAAAVATSSVLILNGVARALWWVKNQLNSDVIDIMNYQRYNSDDYNSNDLKTKDAILIIKDLSVVSITRGSNARLAAGITKDALAFIGGVTVSTIAGLFIGKAQSAFTDFKLKLKTKFSMKKSDEVLVGGVKMKVKDLNSSQRWLIAKNASNTVSKDGLYKKLDELLDNTDEGTLSKIKNYAEKIFDQTESLKDILDIKGLTNSLEEIKDSLPLLSEILVKVTDIALSSVLLKRINRRMGF